MVRIAIQLFTLRDLNEPVPDTVARVGGTEFDGVELYGAHLDAFADGGALGRTAAALSEAGLAVAATHARVERIEDEFDDVVAACEAVGCSTVVVPTYDAEAFEFREGIEAAADRLARLAADLGEHGVDLLYHNHTFEFGDVGGDVAFELFVEHADGRFGFQPDVGLAAHAGYDPLELLALVAGWAPVVHLTDSVPDDPEALHADVGTGVVDVEACARAAVGNGAEWLVCENGRTDDALASLEGGSEAFADLKERVGGETADDG